ncbi:MAG: iron-sulfur cluster assembly scaffold protein [Planctomycetes bacterium]|nr:iron-sulfur cluster assembly scaffold protein [Planctomycetota bacterium]
MARLPPELQAHFLTPRHARAPVGADGLGRGVNPACGDALEFGVWLADGRVRDLAWAGRGCAAALACASLAAERVRGLALADARGFDLARAVQELGGLGPTQQHAVQLVTRAIAEALSKATDSCQS